MKRISDKLIAAFVILMIIIAFRSSILNNQSTATTFGSLLGTLPFSIFLGDIVCKMMQIPYAIPIISNSGVLQDILKLIIMSILQPVFIGILVSAFFPLPQYRGRGWETFDAYGSYMYAPGYRAKEILLSIVAMPLLALVSAWIISAISSFFVSRFGVVISNIFGLLSVALICTIIIGLIMLTSKTSMNVACEWFLINNILIKILTVFLMNGLCIAIYIGILASSTLTIGFILAFIILLIGMNIATSLLRRSIVG